jgi:hypothetical protein
MEDLSNCIIRVTQELKNLQEQLQWAAFQRSDKSAQDRVLNELLDIGLIQDLKRTVDHARHFLWSYIEFAAATCGPHKEVDHAQQSERLARITEMLRLLYGSSSALPQPQTFVERVTLSVARLQDRHLKDKQLQDKQQQDNDDSQHSSAKACAA